MGDGCLTRVCGGYLDGIGETCRKACEKKKQIFHVFLSASTFCFVFVLR